MFPEAFNKGYDCHDVLRMRPWYGQVNPWFWFWLISTPVVVFSVKPDAPIWQRAGRTIFIIALSHIIINLGTHLAMDIKNAPFRGLGMSDFSEKDNFKFHCIDIADGAKYSSALFFAWVYAVIYSGWWEVIWNQYHKRKTKLIDKNFKVDWINKIVVFISVAIPALIAIKLMVG